MLLLLLLLRRRRRLLLSVDLFWSGVISCRFSAAGIPRHADVTGWRRSRRSLMGTNNVRRSCK